MSLSSFELMVFRMNAVIRRHVFTVLDTRGQELDAYCFVRSEGNRFEWRAEIEAPDCHVATITGESTSLDTMLTQVQHYIAANKLTATPHRARD